MATLIWIAILFGSTVMKDLPSLKAELEKLI
jgi:hypothetical protein